MERNDTAYSNTAPPNDQRKQSSIDFDYVIPSHPKAPTYSAPPWAPPATQPDPAVTPRGRCRGRTHRPAANRNRPDRRPAAPKTGHKEMEGKVNSLQNDLRKIIVFFQRLKFCDVLCLRDSKQLAKSSVCMIQPLGLLPVSLLFLSFSFVLLSDFVPSLLHQRHRLDGSMVRLARTGHEAFPKPWSGRWKKWEMKEGTWKALHSLISATCAVFLCSLRNISYQTSWMPRSP